MSILGTRPTKEKAQHLVSKVLGINSGNVLLSHNLEMHYHRGCSVSLPCSEWERVGPLRYDHQSSKPQRLDARASSCCSAATSGGCQFFLKRTMPVL